MGSNKVLKLLSAGMLIGYLSMSGALFVSSEVGLITFNLNIGEQDKSLDLSTSEPNKAGSPEHIQREDDFSLAERNVNLAVIELELIRHLYMVRVHAKPETAFIEDEALAIKALFVAVISNDKSGIEQHLSKVAEYQLLPSRQHVKLDIEWLTQQLDLIQR